MLNFLYSIFILPIEYLFDIILQQGVSLTHSWGLALIFLSIVFNTLILPIYNKVEDRQEEERKIKAGMARQEAMIRQSFKGQERFAMLSTLYRQHGYSSWLTIRSSIGLLLQIPFFFAAYHLLTNMSTLNGIAFGPIKNLGTPDALFVIGSLSVNILPILMTVVNLVSAFFYTHGLSRRDKIQIYGMAALFLILLYNSPAALTFYWTMNNVYSLFKNYIQKDLMRREGYLSFKTRQSEKWHHSAVCQSLTSWIKTNRIPQYFINSYCYCMSKENRLITVCVCLFLPLQFFIYGALKLYILNANDFPFMLVDAAKVTVLSALIFFSVLFCITLISGCRGFTFITALFLALAIAFFIEANCVTVNYGQFDGTEIPWKKMRLWGMADTAIWAACFAAVFSIFLKFKKMRKILVHITLMVMAVQGYFFYETAQGYNKEVRKAVLTDDHIFELSNKRNLIIFVLDSFDTTVFQDFYNKNKEYVENLFQNFTYYPDTVGAGTRTFIAMPMLITGHAYNYNAPYTKFVDNACNSSPFLNELINKNIETGIYTKPSFLSDKILQFCTNSFSSIIKINQIDAIQYLSRFSLFKNITHFIKPYFVFDTDSITIQNKEDNSGYSYSNSSFFSKLTKRGITLTDSSLSVRLYHLRGTHQPYTLTAKAVGVENGQHTSREEQIQGVFYLLENYFNELKQKGIYDQSDIIICADHGYSVEHKECHEQDPLFMVKQNMQTKQFAISNRKLSYLQDIQPLLLSFLNNDRNYVLGLPENNDTPRYFYSNFPTISEGVIEGKAYNNDSFRWTGNKYTMSSNADFSPGEIYHLTLLNNSGHIFWKSGLNQLKPTGVWIVGKEAKLVIPINSSNNQFKMLSLFINKYYPIQSVQLFSNKTKIAELSVKNNKLAFLIPPSAVQNDTLELDFYFPNPHIDANGVLRSIFINSFKLDLLPTEFSNAININNSDGQLKARIESSKRVGDSEFSEITGWAFNPAAKKVPENLCVINEKHEIVGAVTSGLSRPDLKKTVSPQAKNAGFTGYVKSEALKGKLYLADWENKACSEALTIPQIEYSEFKTRTFDHTSHDTIQPKKTIEVSLNVLPYYAIVLDYYRCKILSKITSGKTRRHYFEKRQELEKIRNILKNKT